MTPRLAAGFAVPDGVVSYAVFSDDQRYRYVLRRHWHGGGWHSAHYVNFVMLNPSCATETVDDATLRKCRGYAQRWGYDGMYITNVYALRATDPKDLLRCTDPVGPKCDLWIREAADCSDIVVAAWGANAGALRAGYVTRLLRERVGPRLHYLEMGKHQPKHPLYLRGDAAPKLYKETT